MRTIMVSLYRDYSQVNDNDERWCGDDNDEGGEGRSSSS